uniref:EamA family transporter n=1 Tax=OCS116 cluster bacterium TaxID=2030921 RepID=A0A2A4YR44_9PROT
MKIKLTSIIPLLFVWLWSTGFIGAKYGLPYIEPYFMLFIRFLIAITVFLCIMMVLKAKTISPRQSVNQMLVGILVHGAYLGGVFFAIDEGMPAGIVAIIVGLQPILTAFVSWALQGQSINKNQFIGLLLGFAGIMMVIIGSSNLGNLRFSSLGLAACIVALFGISIGTILQKNLGKNLPLLTSSMFQYIGAASVMAALTYTMEEQIVEYTFSLFAALTWLVLGLSVLAVLLLMYMISEGEVAKVASYFYLVPPVTVFQTWVLFNEQLGILSLIGCVLSICGVYLVVRVRPIS